MTIKNRLMAPAVAFCGLMLWGVDVSANEAMDLLNRMRAAVHSLGYSGQLVYSRGDELSTFRITHRTQGGQEQESVVRLNQTEGMPLGQAESFSLANFDSLHPPGQQTYSFDLGGDAWVAEHPCTVVVVRPKDKLRYLHRYCIDPATGMLLKYSLMNREQDVLEQLMFTQLTIDQQVTASAGSAAPVAVQRASLSDTADTVAIGPDVLGGWSFQSLPAGFRIIRVIPETGIDNANQIVLSDGLTSVSVFIAPAASAKEVDELSYATGATHVLGLEMAGHVITFVGEVPPATLQSIKNGLRYVAR